MTGVQTCALPISDLPGIHEAYTKGQVIDSTGAINLPEQPKTITILGGGVIAVEFATLFNSLGTKVTIIQRSDAILKMVDEDVRNVMQKHLKETGVTIITNAVLEKVEGSTVTYKTEGVSQSLSADYILASLGRKPNLKGFESLGLEVGKQGVVVDQHMETSVKGVYAIGDMCGKMMLAHVASAEGIIAAEAIHGSKNVINYHKVP